MDISTLFCSYNLTMLHQVSFGSTVKIWDKREQSLMYQIPQKESNDCVYLFKDMT